MVIGETDFIEPVCLKVDYKGYVWLKGKFIIYKKKERDQDSLHIEITQLYLYAHR